jgi:hypothetical protein
MTSGPMQVLVVGFADAEPTGEIAAELDRLREHDVVRVVDIVLVTRREDGTVVRGPAFDDAGSLDRPEVRSAVDAVPPGTTAAIAVIEHRWAIPLRAAIERAGGIALADEWLLPPDLVATAAMAAAADVAAAEAAAEAAGAEARSAMP